MLQSGKIGDLPVNAKEKQSLSNYMYQPAYNYNGQTISKMHADLYTAFQNPKAHAQLALLLQSRNKDGTFNFNRIKNQSKSAASQEMYKTLLNISQQPKPSGGVNEKKEVDNVKKFLGMN